MQIIICNNIRFSQACRCFCYCTFCASFCPVRLPSKQHQFQFFSVTGISGITTQYPSGRMYPTNEIAALLLECSAVPALAAIVIMLSLSAMSAVNCVFLSGKAIILCGSKFFSLFQSISFSRLCGVMLCSSAVSLLFNNRMNCGIL